MLQSLWYSDRFRSWIMQIALLGALLGLLYWIAGNTITNLAERGIRTGFDFLAHPARFPISESVVHYTPSDSFLWAFVVGVANTLWLSVITLVLATAGGLFLALAQLAKHPLLSRLAVGYVTLFRNIPLIVQLLFFYGLATSVFPAPRDAFEPMPGVFLSLRGVYAPGLVMGAGGGWVIAASIVLLLVTIWLGNRRFRDVSLLRRIPSFVGIWLVGTVMIGWVADVPLHLESPVLHGLNFRGGMYLSPEFAAIVVGLALYTTAFTGEIIRGGIEAVGKGQWEGGRALGLRDRQIMFRIILPQALRIIVPPMTSQYLSTVKNTTLAVAVGYPELGLVVNTVINQTGQALESIMVMLGVFLTVSLTVSLFMNWFNARIALVER
ncbi:amino acid ABC transporter permease [Thalassospira marina]|uniref:Amino acid ABC transporter permease n=1 Tax=Thalassospira marina TaxID=2048283 RepID=A0A2N3KBV9_9PROT|nr:ABC transporter permease subunit [Thalassospira marina]PKR48048.1 amino acid ABC transporter permease [Thalassospira marina]